MSESTELCEYKYQIEAVEMRTIILIISYLEKNRSLSVGMNRLFMYLKTMNLMQKSKVISQSSFTPNRCNGHRYFSRRNSIVTL